MPDRRVVASKIPPSTRASYDVPKPKNWQDFQRKCVELYREELQDPHAMEYGRPGQEQNGIDILGRRNGHPDHYVGVQCRRVEKPLKEKKILADCRSALTIKAGLKEIIFATTAPDDKNATDAAVAIEKTLRAEGHDVLVVLYGWEALQARISRHANVLAFWNPAAYVRQGEQDLVADLQITEIAAGMQTLLAVVRQQGMLPLQTVGETGDRSAEDPALHAQIDILRDLFQKDNQTRLAERRLLELLASTADAKPWARFRIETNLGSISMELGREEEAARRFQQAYELRPNEGIALANLALARTMQGNPAEGMELAQRALSADTPSPVAVAYLLQAAARSDWTGDPIDLIPKEYRHSPEAGFGLTEFWRRREDRDWPEKTLEISKLHPDSVELRRARSLAVLELAVRTDRIIIGGTASISARDITDAADDMSITAHKHIDEGYTHQHDLLASISNAAVMLRVADRNSDAEALLVRGMPLVAPEPQLHRLLALTQVAQDRAADAIATLEKCGDTESVILRAEMLSLSDRAAALEAGLAIDVPEHETRLMLLKWRMVGEVALGLGDRAVVEEAATRLRTLPADPIVAELLLIRADLMANGEDEQRNVPLLALAQRVVETTELLVRYELADTLLRNGEPDAAIAILQFVASLSRKSPAGILYLQALAAARHDEAFEAAMARAVPELRDDPGILWTRTARLWNMGDLDRAATTIDALIARDPDNAGARLLKIDILARADRTVDLLAELDQPLERLPWKRFEDKARLAGFLAYFGQIDRAITLAYRLYIEHRDLPRAWMTMSSIVIEQGRSLEDRRWDMPVVAPDAAVDVTFEDGAKRFFVVEANASLRRFDQDAVEPTHALVQATTGLSAGSPFQDETGRSGVIDAVRHKYVARFHYVAEHFEGRFPDTSGFRSITLGADTTEMVEQLLEQARARADWIRQEQEQYENGNVPLGLFAIRVGTDPIEVSAGIAEAGGRLRVAQGSVEELQRAAAELEANARKGCTLDLLSFWTAWRLRALDTLEVACGKIHVSQSVVDRLRMRRDRFQHDVPHGLRTGHFDNGRLAIVETTPDALQELVDDTSAALDWIAEHAQVSPVIVTEDLPDLLREHLQLARSDMFDAGVVATQSDTLLICDDLWIRDAMGLISGRFGSWLQMVLRFALSKGHVSIDDYIRWVAMLMAGGQSFIGVDGGLLARAAALDAADGRSPGHLFRTLASSIGGAIAEPRSHTTAVLTCLQILWDDPSAAAYREPATGHLLERLIRERWDDYGALLAMVFVATKTHGQARIYIRQWMAGHFIPFDRLLPPEGRKAFRKRFRDKARARPQA